MDGYLRILLDAGFSPRNAVLAFGLIHAYGVGRATIERRLPGHVSVVRAADRRRWPTLQKVASQWDDLHRPDSRDFADQVILDGLLALLDKQDHEADGPDSQHAAAPGPPADD